MFGIFGDTSTVIDRLSEIVPSGEWVRDDGTIRYGNPNFPRTDVVCALILELGFYPHTNMKALTPDKEFIIGCHHNGTTVSIWVGTWMPDKYPKYYEIDEVELDGMFLNIPDVYQFAISN